MLKMMSAEFQELGKSFRVMTQLSVSQEINLLINLDNKKNLKPRRMRLMDHCVYKERKEMRTGFRWGNLNKREHLEDAGTGEEEY
jgi:hypothetical protein